MRSVLSALRLEKKAGLTDLIRCGRNPAGVSAAFHVRVLLATGGDWTERVLSAKPITFGISVGLLLWTCGWVIDRLPRARGSKVSWRRSSSDRDRRSRAHNYPGLAGVPSHFNFTTATDSIIFSAMGAAIGVFSCRPAGLRSGPSSSDLPDRVTRLAVLGGLALVITGLGLGQWVIGLGVQMAEQLGHAPDTVPAGAAGVAKFPHAMALHGIQLFIAASVLARSGRLGSASQINAVRMTVLGYSTGGVVDSSHQRRAGAL